VPWISTRGDGVLLALHIQPGAKKTELCGLHGDTLKIRLQAPPVDGKANECLLAFVAATLGVARSRVSLVSGQTSRAKRVAVEDISLDLVQQALLP
jgi:hypothetical protein